MTAVLAASTLTQAAVSSAAAPEPSGHSSSFAPTLLTRIPHVLSRVPSVDRATAVVTRLEPLAGTVALTFDDGPVPTGTLQVLNVLDVYGIKATFFVLGWRVRKYPEILAEIAARGHSIQIHSYDHVPLSNYSNDGVRRQLQDTAQQIFDITGRRPNCVRPPYGMTNSRVDGVINGMGYRSIMWSLDSDDTRTQSAWAVKKRVQYWRMGQTILAHDTNWYRVWSHDLGPAIEEMLSRGIGFSTICATETFVIDDRFLR